MRPLCPLIEDNLEAIRALAREFGVARLEVFGSACTPEFDPERSDVDFLVEYPEGYDFGPWLGRRHALRRAMEGILERPVDLVTTRALHDPSFRAEADATRRLIYDAAAIAPAA
jgi:predicted nucleotidyltransferase